MKQTPRTSSPIECRWREWKADVIVVCHQSRKDGPWCPRHRKQGKDAMKKMQHVYSYAESVR